MKAVSQGRESDWCNQNHIALPVIELVEKTRYHLLMELIKSEVYSQNWNEANKNSENWAVIKAAITAGLYPNVLKKEDSKYKSE